MYFVVHSHASVRKGAQKSASAIRKMTEGLTEQRESVLRAAEEVADLEDDVVPAREHVVEIVRVDLD